MNNEISKLKPLPLWQAILIFGVLGAMVYIGIYAGVPFSIKKTGSAFLGLALTLTGACVILFILSIVAFRFEGNEMTWQAFKTRFRLNPLKAKDWLLIIGVTILVQVLEQIIVLSGISLNFIPFFRAPDFIPFPLVTTSELKLPLTEFLGVFLKGAYWMIPYWIIHLFFNIFGEEFMWRGYLLPRQELSYGKWAFLVNGLLWGFIGHAFMKWYFIGMLPDVLLTPWLVQKTKSTWASIVSHGLGNLLVFWMIIPGIF
jgi:membrane protease YdiL (CAAX protease family)